MSDTEARIPASTCPICGKKATPQHRPFCSKRCAMLDLGRWLKGDYRMPSAERPEEAPPDEAEDA